MHQMAKDCPTKTFLGAPGVDGSCDCAQCPFMAKNNLENLYLCMVNESPAISVPEDLRVRALSSLEKMLAMSPPPQAAKNAAE